MESKVRNLMASYPRLNERVTKNEQSIWKLSDRLDQKMRADKEWDTKMLETLNHNTANFTQSSSYQTQEENKLNSQKTKTEVRKRDEMAKLEEEQTERLRRLIVENTKLVDEVRKQREKKAQGKAAQEQ